MEWLEEREPGCAWFADFCIKKQQDCLKRESLPEPPGTMCQRIGCVPTVESAKRTSRWSRSDRYTLACPGHWAPVRGMPGDSTIVLPVLIPLRSDSPAFNSSVNFAGERLG